MTEKVHILQRDYLQMHDLAIMEIQKLKSHLEELKNKQHSELPVAFGRKVIKLNIHRKEGGQKYSNLCDVFYRQSSIFFIFYLKAF